LWAFQEKMAERRPFAIGRMSGKIVSQIEARIRGKSSDSVFVRDNLVKDPRVTNGRLRYPTSKEMSAGWRSFQRRLLENRSAVFVLLGKLVADFAKVIQK
jgi:hypothetical protein